MMTMLAKTVQLSDIKHLSGFVHMFSLSSFDNLPLKSRRVMFCETGLVRSRYIWQVTGRRNAWTLRCVCLFVYSTDLYYTTDRILCSPFSCPSQLLLCPTTGRLPEDSFCPLAMAGVCINTDWRKLLLKNIQQARQACRVQFPIYLSIKSPVFVSIRFQDLMDDSPLTVSDPKTELIARQCD